MDAVLDRTSCPACGGAGGGPFGRAGSAWDDESYVCTRCKGEGYLAGDAAVPSARPPIVAKGIAKATPEAPPAAPAKKRKASA